MLCLQSKDPAQERQKMKSFVGLIVVGAVLAGCGSGFGVQPEPSPSVTPTRQAWYLEPPEQQQIIDAIKKSDSTSAKAMLGAGYRPLVRIEKLIGPGNMSHTLKFAHCPEADLSAEACMQIPAQPPWPTIEMGYSRDGDGWLFGQLVQFVAFTSELQFHCDSGNFELDGRTIKLLGRVFEKITRTGDAVIDFGNGHHASWFCYVNKNDSPQTAVSPNANKR